jgi:hypothetical protein
MWRCGTGFLHRKGTDESRRVRPKEASATPPAFRDVLLAMARDVNEEAACGQDNRPHASEAR